MIEKAGQTVRFSGGFRDPFTMVAFGGWRSLSPSFPAPEQRVPLDKSEGSVKGIAVLVMPARSKAGPPGQWEIKGQVSGSIPAAVLYHLDSPG